MSTNALNKTDVISYSAGRQSEDPFGYRVVRPIQGLLPTVANMDPTLLSMVTQYPSLLIQAYPAPISLLEIGPRVDTYMQVPVASRALALAAATDRTAILSTTPLMAARICVDHLRKQSVFPQRMILAIGGYPCPWSLEKFLRHQLRTSVAQLKLVFLYGQAEIDAALMVAMQRSRAGELIYVPRAGLELLLTEYETHATTRIRLDGHEYTLSDTITRFDDGYCVSNSQRWSSQALGWLEHWSHDDWNRRTGYIHFHKSSRERGNADHLSPDYRTCQLREGIGTTSQQEIDFYDYARKHRMDWLEKPRWS